MVEKKMAPTEDVILKHFETLSNWNKWGPDDVLGSLNFVTDEKRFEAAASVEYGMAVSCAWPLASLDMPRDEVFRRETQRTSGREEGEPTWESTSEIVTHGFHGVATTHLDSLSHFAWRGEFYNGNPASDAPPEGSEVLGVSAATAGVVTRGVLVDVARRRDVKWVEPGEGVTPSELEAVERSCDVSVRQGDAVLLRTGWGLRRQECGLEAISGDRRAGWHAACLPWLHARRVALIGCDTTQEVRPSGYTSMRSPVHVIGIVAMGLWLLDNCDLEALSDHCSRLQKWDFLFVCLPLPIVGGTGSPVNPVAVL
jgi:kynurenine formamidase